MRVLRIGLVVAVLAVLGVAPAAQASPTSQLVSLINAARAGARRPALAVRSDLTSVAYRHSRWMAGNDSLQHNPALGSEVCCWQAVGENVGRGGGVTFLHRAFMDSATHRANILDRDYTEVGVGVVVSGGVMWVTEVFRQPYRAPAKPPVTRRPEPAKPKPVAPTPRRTPRPRASCQPR